MERTKQQWPMQSPNVFCDWIFSAGVLLEVILYFAYWKYLRGFDVICVAEQYINFQKPWGWCSADAAVRQYAWRRICHGFSPGSSAAGVE